MSNTFFHLLLRLLSAKRDAIPDPLFPIVEAATTKALNRSLPVVRPPKGKLSGSGLGSCPVPCEK